MITFDTRFPRLYAAASLKRCRWAPGGCAESCFPRLYAAASLKLGDVEGVGNMVAGVFRGFMPRPH